MKNILFKKFEKSVTDVRKGKKGNGVFLVNDTECFVLSHFIFTNKNKIFVRTLKELQNFFFFFWIRFYLPFDEISEFGTGVRLINGIRLCFDIFGPISFDSIWTSMHVDMKLNAILNSVLLIT